jgi:hypothetical protein
LLTAPDCRRRRRCGCSGGRSSLRSAISRFGEARLTALLEQGRQFGLDLSADFLRWADRGCFMYSINHPKPHVLYDMARKLLRGVGRPSEPIDFDTYAVDDIVRGYVFPVYPEIADFMAFLAGISSRGAITS